MTKPLAPALKNQIILRRGDDYEEIYVFGWQIHKFLRQGIRKLLEYANYQGT